MEVAKVMEVNAVECSDYRPFSKSSLPSLCEVCDGENVCTVVQSMRKPVQTTACFGITSSRKRHKKVESMKGEKGKKEVKRVKARVWMTSPPKLNGGAVSPRKTGGE